jgi:hypothetical protein
MKSFGEILHLAWNDGRSILHTDCSLSALVDLLDEMATGPSSFGSARSVGASGEFV